MGDNWDNPPAREDRYWDAVVRGERAEVAIEPTLAEALARAHGLDDAPAPGPSFVARLERQLVRTASAHRAVGGAVPLGLTAVPNGVSSHPPDDSLVPLVRRPRRWALTWLATAALLLLTLTAGFFVLRLRPDRPAERAFLPAPADWSSTLLLRANLEGLPAGSLDARLDRWTFPPGSGEWRAVAPSLPQLLYVEDGQLTASVDARATLSRASAFKRLAAAVPLGSPIGLRAGDLLVVPPGAGFVIELGGEGAVSPRLLVVSLTPSAGQDLARAIPSGITVETLGAGTFTDLRGGPSVVTLHDLFVAPWVALPAATTASPELLVVESGTVGLRKGPDVPEVTRFASGETSTVVATETLLALRNPGDEPLTLLRLAIIPTATDLAPATSRRPGQAGSGSTGPDET